MIDGFSFPHESGSNVVMHCSKGKGMGLGSSLLDTPMGVSPASYPIHSAGTKRPAQRIGSSAVEEKTSTDLPSSTKVSFSEKLVTGEIEQPFHFDEIEQAQWYTDDDLERIRAECQETIKLHRANEPLSSETHCKRGLESHFRDELAFLRSPMDILNDVLDAQIDLWDNGVDDHTESLAQLYALQSSQYAVKAQITGLHDSKAV
eukprot:CAMPEP_0176021582 /NCGR_PEP_ID=MMETSP0120_2-20121206/10482_1 /TAXON_ID=160619 /ORGANISM="Kryptoperidinium foliaceum, Strain CCMP 1326" /LENGTH=203 /DNA_ID=CAMNT_0017354697 /DNA_START=84 /DNA_END=695 /DNA_ORIENTATION=-